MSGNFNAWEEKKNQVTQMVSTEINQDLHKELQAGGQPGSGVLQIVYSRVFFELGALAKFKSGPCITKGKATVTRGRSTTYLCVLWYRCVNTTAELPGTYTYSTCNYSSKLCRVGLCEYTVNFTQRWNHLKSPNSALVRRAPCARRCTNVVKDLPVSRNTWSWLPGRVRIRSSSPAPY